MSRLVRSRIAGAMLLLAGCATEPIPNSEAGSIPMQRHLLFRDPAPGAAPVVVIRDPGFLGAACATQLLVNDKVAAYVNAGEKVTLHIPEGTVILGAEPDGICGGGRIEVEAKLQAGQKVSYRIAKSQTGSGFYRTTDR